MRWKNGGLWKLKKMVVWNEEEEEDEGEFRKSEGKGKRERNQRVLSERLGLTVWDPRSVQIPRLRIESLKFVTGINQADGRAVGLSDGRHER